MRKKQLTLVVKGGQHPDLEGEDRTYILDSHPDANNPSANDLSTNKVTLIGRRQDADINIPLASVSRKHAQISFDEEDFWITDFSTSGTLLNGDLLSKEKSYALHGGDALVIGNIIIDVIESEMSSSPIKEDASEHDPRTKTPVSPSVPEPPVAIIPAPPSSAPISTPKPISTASLDDLIANINIPTRENKASTAHTAEQANEAAEETSSDKKNVEAAVSKAPVNNVSINNASSNNASINNTAISASNMLKAFFEGAGIEAENTTLSDDEALHFMRSVGAIMSTSVHSLFSLSKMQDKIRKSYEIEDPENTEVGEMSLGNYNSEAAALQAVLYRRNDSHFLGADIVGVTVDAIKRHECVLPGAIDDCFEAVIDTFAPQHFEQDDDEGKNILSDMLNATEKNRWEKYSVFYNNYKASLQEYRNQYRTDFAKAYQQRYLTYLNSE